MNKKLTFVSLFILAIIVSACSGVPNGLTDANGLSAGSGNHSIEVVNNTGEAICYILMSQSVNDSWEDDILSQTQALSNEGSFTIRVTNPDDYDLMVLPCIEQPTEADALAVEYGIFVEGTAQWVASN